MRRGSRKARITSSTMVQAMDGGGGENGIIVPPPETKKVIETTAKAVSRSKDSTMFEQTILKRQPVKCSFLKSTDPYNAYYKSILDSLTGASKPSVESDVKKTVDGSEMTEKEEKEKESADDWTKKVSAPVPGVVTDVEMTEKAASISKAKAAEAKAQASRPKLTEPPPPEMFTLTLPSPAPTALGLEIMKLTAQFAAQGGRAFIAGVNVQEYRNPLFAFLKPEHPHFALFQTLTSMYQETISLPESLTKRLDKLSLSKSAIYDEVLYRVEWDRMKEQESSHNEDEERLQMQLIDWHDFVLVETIELDEEDDTLQAPIAPDPDITARNKEVAAAKVAAKAKAVAAKDDVDMDIDEPVESNAVSISNHVADVPSHLVRPDYVPQVSAARRPSAALTMVLPSGQTVPAAEATASMKVELLDPKYKEERARAADKNRLQNLASDDEIMRNLGRLNDAKTEVFGRVDLQEALHARQVVAPQPHQSSLPTAPLPKPVEAPEARPAIPAPVQPAGTATATDSAAAPANANTPIVCNHLTATTCHSHEAISLTQSTLPTALAPLSP